MRSIFANKFQIIMNYYTWKIFYSSRPTRTIPVGQIKRPKLRETDPGGIRPWVHRGSNLGRGANPNPAYPESNFGSFEGGPTRGRAPRKKSSTVDEKRRERRGARNPRLPLNTQKEEPRRTKTQNFSLRVSDYQRADRLFLPIPLEEISEEKGRKREREKVGDFRPR